MVAPSWSVRAGLGARHPGARWGQARGRKDFRKDSRECRFPWCKTFETTSYIKNYGNDFPHQNRNPVLWNVGGLRARRHYAELMNGPVRILVACVTTLGGILATSPSASAAASYCDELAKYSYWEDRAFTYATETPYFKMSPSQRVTYDRLVMKAKAWRGIAIREMRLAATSESLRLAQDFAMATKPGSYMTASETLESVAALRRSEADLTRVCGFNPHELT